MAYHDENGKITIDEVAAEQDIRRLERAIADLNASKNAMKNLMNTAAAGKGEAVSAVTEKSGEMINKINDMISRLDETVSFIKRTVSHYRQVDENIKNAIKASGGN